MNTETCPKNNCWRSGQSCRAQEVCANLNLNGGKGFVYSPIIKMQIQQIFHIFSLFPLNSLLHTKFPLPLSHVQLFPDLCEDVSANEKKNVADD